MSVPPREGDHTWGLSELSMTPRARLKRTKRAIRQYRYLDPLLKPLFERWEKSLALTGFRADRTALSGHLATLFWECMRSRPDLVVEAGVRSGESTEVFCRAAEHYNGTVVSVDIAPTLRVFDYPNWIFYQERSEELGRRFGTVQRKLGLGLVDVLFLDSSHFYDETVAELEAWLPHLSPTGLLICHDTAMASRFRATDGTLRSGWDNKRGVSRALEEVLGISLDERENVVRIDEGWLLSHTPLSSGLTMLTRTG